MANRGINWYLSALFGVGAVAFGFWLGVSVLNWYSDREYKSEQIEKARPVSILSGHGKKSGVEENQELNELAIIEVNEGDKNLTLIDSLEFSVQIKPDSLNAGNGNNFNGLNTNEILQEQASSEYNFIKKATDQLIATVSFAVPNTANNNSQATEQLDSLLGKLNTERSKEEIITVELWRSPLNYRGYKFSNNVLVVYDMAQVGALKLYQSNGKLFLNYLDVFYQITPTPQFKPLTPTKIPL